MAAQRETALVLLGPEWADAAPFIAIFALVGAARTLTGPPGILLLVLGHSKPQATITWAEFVVFVIAAFALVPSQGFIGLAYARLVSALAVTVLFMDSSHRHVQLPMADLARAMWRPLLGAAGMALVMPWLANCCTLGMIAQLVLEVVVGAVIYIGWMLGSWWAVGRPDGIERLALGRLGLRSRAPAAD